MKAQLEYKQEKYIISLEKMNSVVELKEAARKCFSHLPDPSNFALRVRDGPIISESSLCALKTSQKETVRLVVFLIQEHEAQLIEISSDNSFIRLEEETILDMDSIKLDDNQPQGRDKTRDGSIFLMSVSRPEENISGEDSAKIIQIYDEESKIESIDRMEKQESIQDEELRPQKEKSQPRKEQKGDENNYFQDKKSILDFVQCDICNAFPIKGPVFKCLVCKDFDLCQNCEASYHNFHPSLLITKPQHYPTSLKVYFSKKSKKYMEKHLKAEKKEIQQQKQYQLRGNERTEGIQVDPATLKSRVVHRPNFVSEIVNSRL